MDYQYRLWRAAAAAAQRIVQAGVTSVSPISSLMASEAGEAPGCAAAFLDRNALALERVAERLRRQPPRAIITCARGSSDAAATYAKYLIETSTGVPVASAALSVSSLYAATPIAAPDHMCLAVSQSGRSPDLLRAVEAQRKAGAYVVAFVNDTSSPLALLCDDVLPLFAAPERSVAATKSFVTSLTGIAALVAAWIGNAPLRQGLQRLPSQLANAYQRDWPEAAAMLKDASNLFVLGRGYSFAIAQEAALKLKETCGLHAEAFSSAEVRHGPMALVGEGFPILAFAGRDAAGEDVRKVAALFRDRGARVEFARSDISADPALDPIVQIQGFYRMVGALARARGADPDAPPHLDKITKTV